MQKTRILNDAADALAPIVKRVMIQNPKLTEGQAWLAIFNDIWRVPLLKKAGVYLLRPPDVESKNTFVNAAINNIRRAIQFLNRHILLRFVSYYYLATFLNVQNMRCPSYAWMTVSIMHECRLLQNGIIGMPIVAGVDVPENSRKTPHMTGKYVKCVGASKIPAR